MGTFNAFDAPVENDPSDPDPYAPGMNRFGPQTAAGRMGATVYELPPGKALCPYHYESEEEWLLVLQGRLTVRHPEGEDVLRPGEVTAFPVGPAGAHKTTNDGPTPCASSCSRRATRSATASTPTLTRSRT